MHRQRIAGRLLRVAAAVPLIAAIAACGRVQGRTTDPESGAACILIVIDGLRPDFATPELMPNLTALGASGVIFDAHRSIFPTLTTVNAATLVTGSHPSTHGLLGDQLYFPEVSQYPLNASDAGDLHRIDTATGGRLLTALTLGELLEGGGRDLLVVGTGSSGLAWLLSYGSNPRPGRSSVVSPQLTIPAALSEALAERIGSGPLEGASDAARSAWAADALIELGLGSSRPAVSILWFEEPDDAAHRAGLESAEMRDAVRSVDAQLGRIVQAVEDRGLRERTNLIVTSDHGFVLHSGRARLMDDLVRAELKASPTSEDVIVVGDEIYVRSAEGEKSAAVDRIGRWLMEQPYVGGVFTRGSSAGSPSGRVAGTLSYETIHREASRAGDIMIAPNWSSGSEGQALAGLSGGEGAGGHGGASPYEMQVPLVAAGPGFKRGVRVSTPSSHADVAPTLLALLGMTKPESMEGRVLAEGLRGGAEAGSQDVTRRTYRARSRLRGRDAERIVEVQELGTEGAAYLQWVRVLFRGVEGGVPASASGIVGATE